MTLTNAEKLQDVRYTVMDLPENDLLSVVRAMAREELIEWLCWNDRNGVYRDGDSLAEFGEIMTKAEGEEIKSQAGLNSYRISVKEWVEKTNAKGLSAKAGRYGGTYAHVDIAFENRKCG